MGGDAFYASSVELLSGVLGNIILDDSLTVMSSWVETFDSAPHYIFVNVSPRQFLRGNFVHAVKEALVKYKLPGQLLAFEITEHLLVADFDRSSPRDLFNAHIATVNR